MTDSTPESDPLVLVPLPGSERPAAEGVEPAAVGINHESTIEVTLILRRRASMSTEDALGSPLTSEEIAARFGGDPADAALVGVTLTALGLRVLSTDLASRRIRISGTVANIGRVFGTSISAGTSASGNAAQPHRIRTGGLSIPAQLDGIITAVLGIDDRPQARAQFRVSNASAASISYTPVQLGELYKFPADTDGTGQTIAIIELGGGYETADLKSYFSGLGVGSPSVSAVSVDGAQNEPGKDPTGADGEVLLDIEVIGALSPAAKILVYFAPNTDAGFVDAVSDAAHATPTPTAMSISWGQSEDQWTAQARTALDGALLDAAALGITVTAAAGDNGSSDGSSDGAEHADFPASSPHALACGGTSLRAKGTAIATETVWNDGAGGGATGGGVSDVFALPTWQKGVGVPAKAPGGRGVPDVAGNADPETGYEVLVDGTRAVYGGTSAVAPLWAALVARLAQSLGSPLGLLQPKLYPLHASLRDITSGNNGSYAAKKGWDACTGLGTPNGTAILAALKAAAK
ncbi:MAG TPA: S53 family peptidase [Galbitalea sp.]|nr:S53 family peptidase [Galbitalea sp.]